MARLIISESLVLLAYSEQEQKSSDRNSPVRTIEAEADEEAKSCKNRSDHEWLLAACGGCENTLQLCLGIASGEFSCCDIARTFRKNSGEASRWRDRILTRLNRTLSLAKAAVAELAHDARGFIIEPYENMAIRGLDYWSVSLKAYEKRFPACPDRLQITGYIAAHYKTIFQRDGRYFGGSHDEETGEWRLEVTKLFPSEDKAGALRFARLHRQNALTTPRTAEVIVLSEKKRRAA